MLRITFGCLAFIALINHTAVAQVAPEDASGNLETRRPTGRRLLDEVARERGGKKGEIAAPHGTQAASASRPVSAPPQPTLVPEHSDALPSAPAHAAQQPSAQQPVAPADFPFDAPSQPLPASDRSAEPADPAVLPANRYARLPAAATAPNSEVMPAAYQAPLEPDADQLPANQPPAANGDAALLEQEPALFERAQPDQDASLAEASTAAATVAASEPAAVTSPAPNATTSAPQIDAELASLALSPRGEEGANADDAKHAEGRAAAKSPLTTMIGSLALVLALFFGFVWVMRRATPAGLRQLPAEAVEMLGRAPLPGRQQQMHLLRCGHKLLLVASSSTGCETLTEITDPGEVERLTSICRGEQPTSGSAAFRYPATDLPRDSYARGYGDESLDSAAAALARRLNRSSRLEGSDV